jgi:hypothetical protein
MSMSQLDPGQVLKLAADETNDAIRVNVVASAAAGNTVDIISGDGSGDKAIVTPSNALKVDGSGVTQPVSAVSLPLPTGAASETTLSSIDGKIVNVDTDNVTIVNPSITVTATDLDIRDLTSISDSVSAVQSGTWNINDISGTISLPTGASTSAKQDTGNTSLASIDGKITTVDTGNVTIVNASGASAVNIQDGGNSITVDATDLDIRDLSSASDSVSAVQSGTWNINNISGTISLPTDAASETTLSSIDSKIVAVDTSSVTIINGSGVSAVNIQDGGNSITVDGTVAATQSGTWNINNISGTVSLPTGAATSSKQDTGNTSLASIDTKLIKSDTDNVTIVSSVLPTGAAIASKQPALGTAGTASSDVITVQGIASMVALKVDGSAVTQPVSGTITANAGTGNFTVVQGTGTNLHTVVDSGSVSATQSGSWSTSDVGFSNSEFVRNDYSSVNVTTSAYTQLIASTTNTYQEIEIFDSSGQTLKIAFGGSGSEVDKFLVFPGGNGRIKRNIPSGTRISIKAVSATASVGEISLNLYG